MPEKGNNVVKVLSKVGLAVATLIVTFLLGQWSVSRQVHDLVIDAVKRADVIGLIRKEVRPMMIFDENESYKLDMGALDFIKAIKVDQAEGQNRIISKITIELNSPGPAPLLTCLDSTIDYIITTRPGLKTTWVYDLECRSYSEPRLKVTYFSLQIIKGEAHNIQSSDATVERDNIFLGRITSEPKGRSHFLHIKPGDVPEQQFATPGTLYFDKRENRFKACIDGKWRIILIEDPK